MLRKKTNPDTTQLDDAIAEVYRQMEPLTVDSPEYAKMVDQLDKLYKIKNNVPDGVDLKNWIPVIGSLGGVVLIIVFESMGHTITSKALGFVGKAKA